MSYERQNIDCNCNDCIFLYRDIERYNSSIKQHQEWADNYAKGIKKRYKKQADNARDDKTRNNFLNLINKVKPRLVTKKDVAIHYGKCSRFNKEVSFIPNTIQLDTQDCFLHRKDLRK